MANRRHLEEIFQRHGVTDFRWIDPGRIVVSQWVRMKCMYGCPEYGRTASCPPYTPPVPECERFFREYREAVIFHFSKQVEKPEDRFPWTRSINLQLLKLEYDVFKAGYEKAFLLFLDSCNICLECSGKRETCKSPKQSRPTPEAMAVDVFATVRAVGYPIEVLSRYDQLMNRYAFLMVE